jgi:DIS3-like exonuclease 2
MQKDNDFDPKKVDRTQRPYGVLMAPTLKKLPWSTLQEWPAFLIEDMKKGESPDKKYYEIQFLKWSSTYNKPECKIVKCLGEAGNIDAESARILKEFEVTVDDYSSQSIEEICKMFGIERKSDDVNDEGDGNWPIPQEEVEKRRDLRNTLIFTIDPKTAKDLDDALSIEKISDDVFEVGVHIADVSYFVKEGTFLDEEAAIRATSVYFVHHVYPMLPRVLCQNLCSLNGDVDRLAYSVFFRMSKDG